ncbi:hypothetical protein DFH07DRAFT_771227 [Mycena maculata]|uniref:Uncharacterized protein n=1 Tax=Mycena maculata TaxID=230809 RepID=A0AAD7JCC3_9AGAR|nr:hypothetical protein DFH07DRAFT_771227 [Mycena maculata]
MPIQTRSKTRLKARDRGYASRQHKSDLRIKRNNTAPAQNNRIRTARKIRKLVSSGGLYVTRNGAAGGSDQSISGSMYYEATWKAEGEDKGRAERNPSWKGWTVVLSRLFGLVVQVRPGENRSGDDKERERNRKAGRRVFGWGNERMWGDTAERRAHKNRPAST